MDEVESLRPRAFSSTVGVWRVRSGGDSAVLKLLRRDAGPHPRWPSADEPDDPYYWRRDALAYSTGLLSRLDGVRAAAFRGLHERPDGSLALWLEDVAAPPEWTPERLGGFARRLGRAQALLASRPPDEPWLARGFLRRYLELHDADDPERDEVLSRIDTLPHTLCHNDLHPANVLGADGSVVVDWAFCGLAPLGLDPGVLVADGVADRVVAPADADAAAAAVWTGYANGLRDGGVHDVEPIRWAFLRATALRLAWLDPEKARDDATRESWRATIALLERWRRAAGELPSRP
ncbi:MAG TPA: phosphotransferase [Gaiellaceae bacterium]|nr:phosphotransferase [Gaiellaceae bacterium]